eukprot:29240-Prorocentrum_lima.AAC.1
MAWVFLMGLMLCTRSSRRIRTAVAARAPLLEPTVEAWLGLPDRHVVAWDIDAEGLEAHQRRG